MAQVERATSVGGKTYLTNLLSVFQFGNNVGINGIGQFGFFNEVGFYYDGAAYVRSALEIQAYIPENFTIVSAFITAYHTSGYVDLSGLGGGTEWVYSRKVKLYKLDDITDRYFVATAGSEYFEDGITDTELPNVMGADGFTPTQPTGVPPQSATEKFVSQDLKEHLTTGINVLKLKSSDTLPANDLTMYRKTGQMIATLTVIGYQGGT